MEKAEGPSAWPNGTRPKQKLEFGPVVTHCRSATKRRLGGWRSLTDCGLASYVSTRDSACAQRMVSCGIRA